MADQLIRVLSADIGQKKVITAFSDGVIEEEKKAIFDAVTIPTEFDPLPQDDENEALVGVYSLDLPNGRIALVRSGIYYVPGNEVPRGILHAFIDEKKEDYAPLLYVIHSCFKTALTAQEEVDLAQNAHLSTAAFPHPQFRLNQQEINKFFSSGGRRKTLANLIQAVIDSYDNRRVVILNDRQPTLKYWFFALHACLPMGIRSKITLCSCAFKKTGEFKLICGAPGVNLNVEQDIEKGSFVIDNRGGVSCDDIDAVKYARSIVDVFLNRIDDTGPILAGIESLMEEYHLPISSAAGIYYLLQHDFDWFESAHEIKYFLNKLGVANASRIQTVAVNLWEEIKKPDFKFGCNESLLPVIAYIFRHTDDATREDIRAFLYRHRNQVGINDAQSFHDYYKEIVDKLSFLTEYLPLYLIKTNTLDTYLTENTPGEDREGGVDDVIALIYMIADDFPRLIEKLGEPRLFAACRKILRVLLRHDQEAFLDVCRKTSTLPAAFTEEVLVRSIIDAYQRHHISLGDDFVFAVVSEIADKTASAASLVALYAEKGHYSEATLLSYQEICRQMPQETDAIQALLQKDPAYHAFLEDLAKMRFLSEENVTRQELEKFFYTIYLADDNGSSLFEKRLGEYLSTLVPVRQIEEAGHFLEQLAAQLADLSGNSLAQMLFDNITGQSVLDIYDCYNNDVCAYGHIGLCLSRVHPALGSSFLAAGAGVYLRDFSVKADEEDYRALLLLIRGNASFSPTVFSPDFSKEWHRRFLRYLISFMSEAARREADATDLFFRILTPLAGNAAFETPFADLLLKENVLNEEQMTSFLPPLLLAYSRATSVQGNGEQIARAYFLSIPLKQRPALFVRLLSHCRTEEERQVLRTGLSAFYYSTLSFWQRLWAVKPQKLFG